MSEASDFVLLTDVAGAVFKIPNETAEPYRLTFDEIHAIIAGAQKAVTSTADFPVDLRAEWERVVDAQSEVEGQSNGAAGTELIEVALRIHRHVGQR